MSHVDTEVRPSNFIRNIIDEDLKSGKHTSVQTRFPPEPNGYLHIGHAKSICLNFGIARDYQGLCNLRFDDTNPEKEDIDYVNSIQADVRWLGFQWDGEVRYSSNYFDQLHQYAVELINKGLAYVCFLNADETREYRGTLKEPGKNSPYRDTPVEENLRLFEKMRLGEFKEGECALRAKIDMASPFMCMRDPVIYRIRFAHHHQTGDKWCIYPMYDFTHCISDALEHITHSLCTLEFQDNRRLYDWVLDNLDDFQAPNRTRQYEFSRLNLEYTLMSKRKLNDLAKQENMIEAAMLDACIREELNEHAPRAMAVLRPLKVVIENYPEGQIETIQAASHPSDESMGTRELAFGRELYIDVADFREEANKQYKRLVMGKEVRLRNAYVIKAERCDKDSEGNITTVYCSYDADTLGKNPADGRKVKGVIHWVEATTAKPAEFRLYQRLFTDPNPAAAETVDEVLNPNSLEVVNGLVEASLANAPAEKAYQFEREGYFCADNKDSSAEHLVFNLTVALRDSFE